MDTVDAVTGWWRGIAIASIRTENLPPGGNEKPGQEFLRERITPLILVPWSAIPLRAP